MQAICFDGKKMTLRDDLPEPIPQPGEALIKVRKAGVCRTDLEILKGYMGFVGIMGHEFVGEVIDGPAELRGHRVVGEINCLARTDAQPAPAEGPVPPRNHDPARTVLGIDGRDGCFAEYVALPAENLHRIPDDVDDDAAVFVEPLAAACRILEQVDVAADDRIAVFGDGRLGLLCSFVLRTVSERVTLVGHHRSKLALAGKRDIATALSEDVDAAGQFDIVVDATGKADGFTAAVAAVRPLGTMVLKSTVAAEAGMNLAPLVINELTVIGSRCGPFETAVAMLADGEVDPRDMITGRFPLRRGCDALRAAAKENIKVLIDV
jgi:threonine dehydrogenase-like Zn-dependent dehydrogenase